MIPPARSTISCFTWKTEKWYARSLNWNWYKHTLAPSLTYLKSWALFVTSTTKNFQLFFLNIALAWWLKAENFQSNHFAVWHENLHIGSFLCNHSILCMKLLFHTVFCAVRTPISCRVNFLTSLNGIFFFRSKSLSFKDVSLSNF